MIYPTAHSGPMPREDTKAKLLDTAQDLIQRVGANAMSYQHLSEAVGIRKASIHYHFPTKQDLLSALIDRYQQGFMDKIRAIEIKPINGHQQLVEYIDAFAQTLREDDCAKACLCGVLGAEIASLTPTAGDQVRRFYTDNEAALTRILEKGKTDDSLSHTNDITALAALIFAALEGGMFVARSRQSNESFKAMTDQILAMVSGD